MKIAIVIFSLCGLSFLSAQETPAKNAEFKQIEFLVGDWGAKTKGGSAAASGEGTYTFRFDLHKHILTRTASYSTCKGPATFDCTHTDLLVIYSDGPGAPLKAIYFDSDGHVIHYGVSIPEPTTVVFLSDPSQTGLQFRLRYELKGATMNGEFAMRSAPKEDFKPYLEWAGDRH